MTIISLRCLIPGALLFGATAALLAEGTTGPDAPHSMPAAPSAHHQEIHLRHLDCGPKETVTFLGVETTPVSKALIAQLNLPNRAGLVVQHVVAESGAAAVLKESDILLKLDDQILVDQHQLSVLVRGRSPGDEVTVTYMRAGKTETAKLKLGQHEVAKFGDVLFSAPGGPLGLIGPGPGEPAPSNLSHEHAARMLSMIDRAHHGDPVRIEIQHGAKGEGMHAVKMDTGNSTVVYSDEQGSIELTTKAGAKSVVAKNAKGEPEFAGPATTDEDRKRLPASVRARLDKIESMQNVTFQVDDDFGSFETEVAPVEGTGVSLYRRVIKRTTPTLQL